MSPPPGPAARRPRRRLLLATALALLLAVVAGACSRATPTPVDDAGQPLAQDDPARYVPPRLDGLRLTPLAPHEDQQLADRVQAYAMGDWITSVEGALRSQGGETSDPAPVLLLVARTDGTDPQQLQRLAFLRTQPGELSDVTTTEVDGEQVVTGTVTNDEGRSSFISWQANDQIAVSLVAARQASATGYDPEKAMSQLIAYARS